MGNTLYPLLQEIPAARCYACDFSATAVECLREHAAFDPNHITAWEEDITSDAGLCGLGKAPANGVDYCTLVFVLSALAPDKMPQVPSTNNEIMNLCNDFIQDLRPCIIRCASLYFFIALSSVLKDFNAGYISTFTLNVTGTKYILQYVRPFRAWS